MFFFRKNWTGPESGFFFTLKSIFFKTLDILTKGKKKIIIQILFFHLRNSFSWSDPNLNVGSGLEGWIRIHNSCSYVNLDLFLTSTNWGYWEAAKKVPPVVVELSFFQIFFFEFKKSYFFLVAQLLPTPSLLVSGH